MPLKKHKRLRHSSKVRKCIIHNNNLHDYGDVKPFTDYEWEKVCEMKRLRMASDDPKNKLNDICEKIPDSLEKTNHGYHRPCYQTFTYTRFLKKRAGDDQEATCSQRKKRATETSGTLFSKDMCIICEKRSKYVKRKSEKLVKCITETAKKYIEEAAERKDDSRLKGITGNYCLVAKEAHYHDSCRREYTRKDDRHQAATDPALLKSEKAHADAFTHIKGYVQKYIIENSQVERMTMLTEKYCLYMQSHHPEVYNPNYKTYKLKEKLLKAFGSKLQFWQPNYRSELVFSAEVPKGCAVEAAFECASSDERRLEEAALVLRRLIFDSFKNAPEMPWPPSADYLLSDQIQVPAMLTKFLRSLLSKRASASTGSIRCDRLVQSIGQDICYNVTCGQWKLPKSDFLWMFCRLKLNESKCKFPSWKGWLSATQETHTKSVVDYMAHINAPINENSITQAVIQISQVATREVEQEYIFVTFNLAVSKKAYALIWHDAERYKYVVIHLGVFHTVLSYLGALGKLMKGSGFEDIITEAGLCASGSLDKMMNGKHYNRALRVHTIMLEALERLLFTAFEQNTGSVDVSDKLVVEAKELVTNLGSNAAETTLASQAFDQLFAQYEYFKKEVRAGRHGKTSQFWVQYMDRVWLLLRFLRATKMNDLDLHITYLQQLFPLLFSMDHHNYARYLTIFHLPAQSIRLSSWC